MAPTSDFPAEFFSTKLVRMDDANGVSGDRLAELKRLAVIQSLRQAGAVLDHLLLDATMQRREEAMRMADATQAVHRALVSLS